MSDMIDSKVSMDIEVIDHGPVSLQCKFQKFFRRIIIRFCFFFFSLLMIISYSSALAYHFDSFSFTILFKLKFQITLKQRGHIYISAERTGSQVDIENSCSRWANFSSLVQNSYQWCHLLISPVPEMCQPFSMRVSLVCLSHVPCLYIMAALLCES